MVWKYTDLLFGRKTVVASSFGKCCADKVNFTAAHTNSRQCGSGKVSIRFLYYVAKEQYYVDRVTFEYNLFALIRLLDDIAKKIVDYLPNYQNYIEDMKREG